MDASRAGWRARPVVFTRACSLDRGGACSADEPGLLAAHLQAGGAAAPAGCRVEQCVHVAVWRGHRFHHAGQRGQHRCTRSTRPAVPAAAGQPCTGGRATRLVAGAPAGIAPGFLATGAAQCACVVRRPGSGARRHLGGVPGSRLVDAQSQARALSRQSAQCGVRRRQTAGRAVAARAPRLAGHRAGREAGEQLCGAAAASFGGARGRRNRAGRQFFTGCLSPCDQPGAREVARPGQSHLLQCSAFLRHKYAGLGAMHVLAHGQDRL